MNENNIKSLREELAGLGFSEETAERMREKMQQGLTDFTLREQVKGLSGTLDLDLYFRQSSKSDFYYFNKFEVTQGKGWSLEEGQQYFVLEPSQQGKLELTLQTLRVAEAVEAFKGAGQTAKLGFGRSLDEGQLIVEKTAGRLSQLPAEFIATYRNPPVSQTMWVDRGKGFSVSQAINLMEGRSVYRDDLMSQAGTPYKAWVKLDMDGERDRYQNYKLATYSDPGYGFDLKAQLDRYPILGMDKELVAEGIITALKNGDRPLVQVSQNGVGVPLQLEAVPRFMQVNLYSKEGKSLKRDEFLKQENGQDNSRQKTKQQKVATGQRLGI